ncbi:uncharacterized protein LOC127031913 [Gopherus flavomarginatus]|uniref:uncharacterized protein LOC127031913 n=1 Tax=Gopherus flavomarginatus TaxID=286002 RepID=UPI0021CBD71B|nr:uncharacterized protein LOC127031913 [Gopherus flavomarginatus]XP_050774886.1 uncharacterized protein LOC127031913 [Gopherus flavomarginatus]XP_050774887.1 uncharacterized protein LOC127031913 [Gopherus flavomarginatus]XP_050774888.1 uncharacterized protein LOC127031913 [Gopherus flavomarginatus]
MSSEHLHLLGVPATLTSHSKDLQPLGSRLLSDHARTSGTQASPPALGVSIALRTSGPHSLRCLGTCCKDLQPLGVPSGPQGQNSSALKIFISGESLQLSGCSKDLQPLGFSTTLGVSVVLRTCSKDLQPLGFSSTPGVSTPSGLALRTSSPWGSPPPQGSPLFSGLALRTSSPWGSPPPRGSPPPQDLLQGPPAPGVLLHPRGLRCSQDLLQGPPAPGARSLGTLHPAPRRRAAPTFALSPPGRQPALGSSTTTTLSLAAPPRPSKPGRVLCDWTGRCLATLGTAVRLADEGRPRCEMVPGASGSTFISSCLFGFLMFFKTKEVFG